MLKKSNLIVDFIPLIADFDKSRLKLGNTSFLAKNTANLKYNILKKTNYIPLIELRYQCKIDYGVNKCIKIKTEDFDMYCIYIYFYLFILKNNLIYSEN